MVIFIVFVMMGGFLVKAIVELISKVLVFIFIVWVVLLGVLILVFIIIGIVELLIIMEILVVFCIFWFEFMGEFKGIIVE